VGERRWIYLAGPAEALELLAGGPDIHHSWPPPGTTIGWNPAQIPEGDDILGSEGSYRTLFFAGVATAEDWPPGRYWTTLGDFLANIHWPESAILARALRLYSSALGSTVGAFASWPVYYDSAKGETMRWIRHTLRGTLGGTLEQFQHKMDWGIPGDDPDISEAEGDALAVVLATAWKSAWTDAGIGASDLFSTNVGTPRAASSS